MKDSLINRFSVLEVLDHNAFQQRGGDLGIPDAFRIHDHDRTIAAHAKARSLAALHSLRTKQQVLTLQQIGEK